MGSYVNPGNEAFAKMLRGHYVDKTGLIGLVSDTIGKSSCLTAVSRPRRFGKSYAAQALVAYYSRGCDSRELFAGLAVSQREDFEEHLNAHDVIRLDMTSVARVADRDSVAKTVERLLLAELHEQWPGTIRGEDLVSAILDVRTAKGDGFVFVIDEWDAPIREARGEAEKHDYIDFLRWLFKNGNFTAAGVEAAYLTGILPIVKYGTQSAMSDFEEYTMVDPRGFAPYAGFTEREVQAICDRSDLDFAQMRRWYDGYELPGIGSVYSPFSVMRAKRDRAYRSYWTSTSTFDSLLTYIQVDFDGLQDTVGDLIAGESAPVSTLAFRNDMDDVRSADDVLTVLIHLGYLAYDRESDSVRVPNEELRLEFVAALRESAHPILSRMVREADELLSSVTKRHDCRIERMRVE